VSLSLNRGQCAARTGPRSDECGLPTGAASRTGPAAATICPMRVTVVGAGINGLACALRLQEAGHTVAIVAAAPPEETTSAVAAALWYPYRAFPEAAVTRWAAEGFAALATMAADLPSGVRMRTGREVFRAPAPDPWWRDAVPSLRRVLPGDLPTGYADGFELTVPIVDMATHLSWLLAELTRRGVTLTQRRLAGLDELAGSADAVVNCTGLGARELVGDDTLVPVRGQIVVVEQVGLERWVLDQDDPQQVTYVVPRLDTIVLGGTAEEGDEDTAVRPATVADVLARCSALVPEIAGARVLAHRVGLRPTRPAVRLEAEDLAGQLVVHCYGQGGAGVTLAYGCAQDVVQLLSPHS
jgi:D-amino-acid oxidase